MIVLTVKVMQMSCKQLLEAVMNILIPVISPYFFLGWTPADIGPSTLEKLSSIIPLYKVRMVLMEMLFQLV